MGFSIRLLEGQHRGFLSNYLTILTSFRTLEAKGIKPEDICVSPSMFMLYGKKYPNEVLLDEILKCRILCHNCHMEQTHNKRPIPNKPMYGMSYQELEFNLKNEVKQIDL